jgi:hypothetical protein
LCGAKPMKTFKKQSIWRFRSVQQHC